VPAMSGVEIAFGMFLASLPFGCTGASIALEADRILKINDELLTSLRSKVEKLLVLVAKMQGCNGASQKRELQDLLDRAAHHIGAFEAGQEYCEKNGAFSCRTIVHKVELYLDISSESLRILLDDVNSVLVENSEDLCDLPSRLEDEDYQAFPDEVKLAFEADVHQHRARHFGKLQSRFGELRSSCLQHWDSCCSGKNVETEFEDIV